MQKIDEYGFLLERQYINLLDDQADNQTYTVYERFGSGNIYRCQLGGGIEWGIVKYDSLEGRVLYDGACARDLLEVTLITNGVYKTVIWPCGEVYEGRKGDLIVSRLQQGIKAFDIQAHQFEAISIMLDLSLFDDKQELLLLLKDSLPEVNEAHFYKMVTASQKIIWLFQRLLKDSFRRSGRKDNYFQWKGTVFFILSESLKWARQQGQDIVLSEEDRRLLHLAKEILMERIDSPPSLAELSRLCCMNQNKLKKGFKQLFQTTISDFVLEGKVQKGKYWLEETDMTIAEIAEALGYQNPSKFSRLFKKRYGLTPREWRNRS
ncbi:AraC family transcriptional regulator [Aeribacillus pallidus]|uniref:helix-turn-helix domain-containing protein n=1 Tax=Aeribacillus composti TaxID=1868734 RepID=UPI0028728D25|nr:AraC family transcriptional regulator [Aeribacillus pallidus]